MSDQPSPNSPATTAPASLTPYASGWAGDNPFRGASAYALADAAIFAGRAQEIEEGVARLTASAGAGKAMLLLTGATGVGKTSLMLAGLAPALTFPGRIPQVDFWRLATLTLRGLLPSALSLELARALTAPAALPELLDEDTSLEEVGRDLEDNERQLATMVKGALQVAALKATASGGRSPRGRLLLLVDGLEDLLAPAGEAAARRHLLLKALDALSRGGRAWVVGTVGYQEADATGQNTLLNDLRAGAATLEVGPMNATALARVVKQPVLAAGLRYPVDPETETALDIDLREQIEDAVGALPLWSHYLAALWARPQSDADTAAGSHARVLALGDFATYAHRLAQHALEAAPAEARAAFGALVPLLVRVRLAEGVTLGGLDLRLATLAEVQKAAPGALALVRHLVAQRVLVAGALGNQGAVGYLLAHHALLEWPSLVRAVDAAQDILEGRARLELASRQWQGARTADDFLLPEGAPLAQAQALVAKAGPSLPPAVAQFVQKSAEASAARQQARRQRQSVLLGSAAAAGVALAAGAWWVWQTDQNQAAELARMTAARDSEAKARATAEGAYQTALQRYLTAASASERPDALLDFLAQTPLSPPDAATRAAVWPALAQLVEGLPNDAAGLALAERALTAAATEAPAALRQQLQEAVWQRRWQARQDIAALTELARTEIARTRRGELDGARRQLAEVAPAQWWELLQQNRLRDDALTTALAWVERPGLPQALADQVRQTVLAAAQSAAEAGPTPATLALRPRLTEYWRKVDRESSPELFAAILALWSEPFPATPENVAPSDLAALAGLGYHLAMEGENDRAETLAGLLLATATSREQVAPLDPAVQMGRLGHALVLGQLAHARNDGPAVERHSQTIAAAARLLQGTDHDDGLRIWATDRSAAWRGKLAVARRDWAAARQLLEQGLARLEDGHHTPINETVERAALADESALLAEAQLALNVPTDALATLRAELFLREPALAAAEPAAIARAEVIYDRTAQLATAAGDAKTALADREQRLALHRQHRRPTRNADEEAVATFRRTLVARLADVAQAARLAENSARELAATEEQLAELSRLPEATTPATVDQRVALLERLEALEADDAPAALRRRRAQGELLQGLVDAGEVNPARREKLAAIFFRQAQTDLAQGRLPVAESGFGEAITALEALQPPTANSGWLLAQAYVEIGELQLRSGNFRSAGGFFEKGLTSALNEERRRPGDAAAALLRARLQVRLAGVVVGGDTSAPALARARQLLDAALATLTPLGETDTASSTVRILLAEALQASGDAYFQVEQAAEALPAFVAAVEQRRRALNAPEAPMSASATATANRELAYGLLRQGEAHAALRQDTEALAAFQGGLALLDGGTGNESVDPRGGSLRAIIHRLVADSHARLGNTDAALTAYGAARRDAEDLARRQPEEPRWALLILQIENATAGLQAQRGDPAAAIASFQRALAAHRRLDEMGAQAAAPFAERVLLYRRIGSLQLQRNALDDAAATYAEAANFAQRQVSLNPADAGPVRALSELVAAQAEVARRQRQTRRSAELYTQAREIYATISTNPSADDRSRLASLDLLLGRSLVADGQRDLARSAFRRATEALSTLQQRNSGDLQLRLDLANACLEEVSAYQGEFQDNLALVQPLLLRARNLLEPLVAEAGLQPEQRRTLQILENRLRVLSDLLNTP